ncbi:putative galacturonosyltransferase 14 [Hordeum vulgare]|nr:putative galacturonosyltransferase 14 [Hordeum vulgare]
MSPPPLLKAPPCMSTSRGQCGRPGQKSAGPVAKARRPGGAAAMRFARPPSEKKGKVSGVKRKKVHTKRSAVSSSPSAPAKGIPIIPFNGLASTTSEVFDEMAGSNDATSEFVNLFDTNTVDTDQAPIIDFDYNEMDGGVDGHGGEDEVEEIDEGPYDQAQAKKRKSKNYSLFEDQILIKAWSVVSLDVCTGTSQTAKRYWQRVEDQCLRMMAKYPNRTPCTFQSFQGQWDVIKTICSRWTACLEQVRNAPPSGTVESNYDKIAQQRYKDMEAF